MASDWHPAMAQPEASTGAEGTARQDAEGMARQAASFLAATVHDEIDGARVGSTRILLSDDRANVYAGAVVSGPLRIYVATAWGASGHAAHKHIVSYPDAAAAQAALDATLSRQQAQGYVQLGTIDGETGTA